MFAGKARSLDKCRTFLLLIGLKGLPGTNSSLLGTFVNYDLKSFMTKAPGLYSVLPCSFIPMMSIFLIIVILLNVVAP